MHKQYRQRLAKEYRYAATKMREATQPAKKLFYFSVLFGEPPRVLNWEWDTNLALIYAVTHHVHTQISAMQNPATGQTLPIDWQVIFDKLTQTATNLADYFEKEEDEASKEELCQILGQLAKIAYAVSGNGSYLLEKGAFKL